MRGLPVLLCVLSACATTAEGRSDLLSRLEQLPLTVHASADASALSPGRRLEILPCCVLGEETLTVVWTSAVRQGRRLRVAGYVRDGQQQTWPGVAVFVGRTVDERLSGTHVAEVKQHTRTDDHGRFDLSVDTEPGLHLYVAYPAMTTSEYDLDGLAL